MPRIRKKVLCFTLGIHREYNYDHLRLRIYWCKEESVRKKLAGTVGNKAGYGTPEAAKRLGRWFQKLLDDGHRVTLDSLSRWDSSISPDITIDWQIYQPEYDKDYHAAYCDPRFELGDNHYVHIQAGAKALKRLGKKIEQIKFDNAKDPWDEKPQQPSDHTFKDPVDILTALQAMGAKRVKHIRGEGPYHYDTATVYDPQPREWLFTDSLYRTMEMNR